MQGQPREDPGPLATARGLCGPKASTQEWWLLMSPRSCLATVSINFCLSRSFFRNCANMLFLRLVSFILNREGEKEGKVFEIVPDKEQAGSRKMARQILTLNHTQSREYFHCAATYLLWTCRPSGTHKLPDNSYLWSRASFGGVRSLSSHLPHLTHLMSSDEHLYKCLRHGTTLLASRYLKMSGYTYFIILLGPKTQNLEGETEKYCLEINCKRL